MDECRHFFFVNLHLFILASLQNKIMEVNYRAIAGGGVTAVAYTVATTSATTWRIATTAFTRIAIGTIFRIATTAARRT